MASLSGMWRPRPRLAALLAWYVHAAPLHRSPEAKDEQCLTLQTCDIFHSPPPPPPPAGCLFCINDCIVRETGLSTSSLGSGWRHHPR